MLSPLRRACLFVIIAGVATLATLIWMVQVPQDRLHDNRTPPEFQGSMVLFELLENHAELERVLGPLQDEPDARRLNLDKTNRRDFAFMIAYSLLNAALALFAYRLTDGRQTKIGRQIFLGVGLFFAFAMLIGDAIENMQLLTLTHVPPLEAPQETLSALYFWTRIKWFALFLASALFAGGWIAQERRWWTIIIAVAFAIAALIGLLGLQPWIEMRPLIELTLFLFLIAWMAPFVQAIVLFIRRGRPQST